MDATPAGSPSQEPFTKSKKRREHRKRLARSSAAASAAAAAAHEATALHLDHQRRTAAVAHQQSLLRLQARHALEISVQAAKSEQEAARAQSAQEYYLASSIRAATRERIDLAETHRQQLFRLQTDHLLELAALSSRAEQDSARAQAAEAQLLRDRETSSAVSSVTETLTAAVTSATDSACAARTEAASLRSLLAARDEELAALRFSAADRDRRSALDSRARVATFLADSANFPRAPPPKRARAPSPPAPRPPAPGSSPRP